jgi:hypothetical protein
MYVPVVLVTLLLIAPMVFAQSLADVARKERKRRERNRSEGVVVHEYVPEEDTVASGDGDPGEEESGEEGASSADVDGFGGEADAASRPYIPSRVDVDVDVDADAGSASQSSRSAEGTNGRQRLDEERRERQRQETEWRARVRRARARVEQARARRQALDELYLVEGEMYVDENGKPVIESLDQLRRLVREADEELAAAERALADLQEEARRQGVPPGWLR